MKELVTASVRIAGLLLLVLTLSHLPNNLITYSARAENSVLLFALVNVIPVIIGIFLCAFPSLISAHLISTAPKKIKLENPRMVIYTGCILIGVYILVYSFADLVYFAIYGFLLRSVPDFDINALTLEVPSIVASIAELIVALCLIFKSRLIVNVIIGKPK